MKIVRFQLTSLAAPGRASQCFRIQLFPLPHTSINVAAHRKESACHTLFGIFSLD